MKGKPLETESKLIVRTKKTSRRIKTKGIEKEEISRFQR